MFCQGFHPGQPFRHLLPLGFRIRQLAAKFCDTVPEAPHDSFSGLMTLKLKMTPQSIRTDTKDAAICNHSAIFLTS